MRVKIEEVAGVRTRYYYEGTGVPLLLLHGGGVSSDAWVRNIDSLARSFRVIAPDLLGHGFTGTGQYAAGPPHPHIVEHLVALADHLGLEQFYVAGSSFGALIASLLYFRLPQRVRKLVVVSSGSFANSDEELAVAIAGAYENSRLAVIDPSAEDCRQRLANIFYSRDSIPEELITMQLTIAALPGIVEAFEARMKGMMDIAACRPYRILDRLEQFALPTLLVWGAEDRRGILSRAQEAAARMPDASLVAFARCKHHPHIEHPELFNELIRAFLRHDNFGPAMLPQYDTNIVQWLGKGG